MEYVWCSVIRRGKRWFCSAMIYYLLPQADKQQTQLHVNSKPADT